MARIEGLTTQGIIDLVGGLFADQAALLDNTYAPIDEPISVTETTNRSNAMATKAPVSSLWAPNTSYKAGQLVVNAGRFYTAKIDFTSGSLPFVTTNWNLVEVPIPVANQAARDALTAYDGMQVYRLDLKYIELYKTNAWVPASGFVICTSTTRPTPVAGLVIWEEDTKLLRVWISTLSVWKRIDPTNVTQSGSFTISFSAGVDTGTINFPVAFTATPVVILSSSLVTGNTTTTVNISGISTGAFTYRAQLTEGASYNGNVTGYYIARGPVD